MPWLPVCVYKNTKSASVILMAFFFFLSLDQINQIKFSHTVNYMIYFIDNLLFITCYLDQL